MVKAPLTRDVAEAHVRGKTVLGGVASDEDGYTTCVGLDLDAHLSSQRPAAAAKRFAQVAIAMDVPVVLHASKSGKGAHIRTLFKQKVPTHLARALYLALVIAAGLSADSAVDKVWPPSKGLGVLALPYNGKIAKQTGGTLALDAWSLAPLDKQEQVAAVLDTEEMDREELEQALVSMQIRTDREARLLSGGGGGGGRGSDTQREVKNQADGGIHLMINHCEAVKRLADEAPHVPYEFWFAMMTNFRPFIGGYDLFEEFSRLDPVRYDARRMTQSWQAISGGPRLCENLQTGWRCPKRGECAARSPAGLPFALKKAGLVPQA